MVVQSLAYYYASREGYHNTNLELLSSTTKSSEVAYYYYYYMHHNLGTTRQVEGGNE